MQRRTRGPLRWVALLAVPALLLAACGDDAADEPAEPAAADDPADEPADDPADDPADEPADEPEAPAERPSFLTLGTGSTGGTYYPLGGAMTVAWNNHLDIRFSTQATGASVENMRLLGAGELELVMAVNGVAADAYAGIGGFDGEDIDVTVLGNIYPEVMQIVARADAGVATIEDMAGKRIGLGPPGSGTEVAARQILAMHGIDPDSDIDGFNDTFGDTADRLRDGTIDAAFAILALPAAAVEEVATNTDIVLVDVVGDGLDALLAADATLSVLEIPAGTYPGQDTAAQTVTNWATLYAPSWLPDDVVYDIVRVLYEHTDEISAAHAVGSQIQLETAIDGLGGIPLHPGAERYYQEQGLL